MMHMAHASTGAAVSFLGMWTAMMAAMMLPSLLPSLGAYRRTVATRATHPLGMTSLLAIAYVAVWAIAGIAAYLASVTLSRIVMHESSMARVLPIATGVVVVMAGVVQLSAWKAHHLAQCRAGMRCEAHSTPRARHALRAGVRLGVHCVCSCAGLTLILLVAGMMDVRVMTIVTVAITIERLAPWGARAAPAIGVASCAAGLLLVARAVWNA